MPHPHAHSAGVSALSLLHLVAFAALGVFGIARLFVAYLGNEVGKPSLLAFGYGAAALASAWALYALSLRNPWRNRRAAAALAGVVWVDAALILLALPTLFYRLRPVPLASWVVALPTLIFAVLATRQAFRRSSGHRIVPAGAPGDAAE